MPFSYRSVVSWIALVVVVVLAWYKISGDFRKREERQKAFDTTMKEAEAAMWKAKEALDPLEGMQEFVRLEILRSSLVGFRTVCGRFPTSEEGLNVLLVNNTTPPADCPAWKPKSSPYALKEMPLNRGNAPFAYVSDGDDYQITVLGSDKFDWDVDIIVNSGTRLESLSHPRLKEFQTLFKKPGTPGDQ